MVGHVVFACEVGLLIVWVALAFLLLAVRPSLPRSIRWRLRIAVIYNLQPINVIPDFIPVTRRADNAIVLIWA